MTDVPSREIEAVCFTPEAWWAGRLWSWRRFRLLVGVHKSLAYYLNQLAEVSVPCYLSFENERQRKAVGAILEQLSRSEIDYNARPLLLPSGTFYADWCLRNKGFVVSELSQATFFMLEKILSDRVGPETVE